MQDLSSGELSKRSQKRINDGSSNEEKFQKFFDNETKPTASEQLLAKFKQNSSSMMNLNHVWNGSLSSLMSCDNLTENLIAESVKELEQALCDSQKILTERDREILDLRQALQDCKVTITTDFEKQNMLLKELEKSQQKILELETQVMKKNEETSKNSEMKRELSEFGTKEHQQSINVSDTSYPECTCYCGSVCNALREVNDVKGRLERTEHKYANLKRKIRERRKAELDAHRETTRMTVNERSPGCILQ
eukprot:gene12183-13440_t